MVLGGCAHHGRAPDVDLLDDLVESDARALHGRGERVQVDHDQLEGRDPGLDDRLAVGRQASIGQDPAVDPRVERLDPPVQHLGEAGDRRDVRHR
jgi:hypothetical protein